MITCGIKIFRYKRISLIFRKKYYSRTKYLLRNRNYNFYDVLGIDRECSNDQIKEAYFKLAKQYHPDLNNDPCSDEKFKMITLAYEALNNERNRDLYDAYMDSDPYSTDYNFSAMNEEENYEQNFFNEKAKWDKFSEQKAQSFWSKKNRGNKNKNSRDEADEYEEDFFKDYEKMFRYGYKKTKTMKGEDIFIEIKITFEESYRGTTKGFIISDRRENCKSCKGTKSEKGYRPSRCFNCNGTGNISHSLYKNQKCPQCHGEGVLIRNPCK